MLVEREADAERLKQTLQRAGLDVVAERVTSKDRFTLALRRFAPDVVLSDHHSVAQFSAPEALAILHGVRPSTPLIVVSDALDARMIVACLRAGADDVVPWSNLSRLPAAIESAVSVRRPLKKLTPRQLQVLRLVVEGLTTPQIALRLRLSAKTVDTHRTQLMKRLGIHDVVALVRYAVRVGLVSAESPIG